MTSASIFDLGGGNMIALNPAHVRFVRSAPNGSGVHVYFSEADWMFIPDVTVEAVALALFGATVGPGQDCR